MKRILFYSSLSVLTAIGTAFTAANAEMFSGEETTSVTAAQLANGATFLAQVPGTTAPETIPTAKPTSANPSAPEADVDGIGAGAADTGVETLTPVPGAVPLSPVPASGVVPAAPPGSALGSPVLPAAPGTMPLDADSAEGLADEDLADEDLADEDLADEALVEDMPADAAADDGLENDSFDATPAEAPLTDAPLADELVEPLVEEDADMEGDMGADESMPVDEAPLIEEDAEMEDDAPLPAPPGSGFTPGAPDSNFTPSEPDSNFTPSAPDSNFTPSAPDSNFTPSAPDSNFTPSSPEGFTSPAPSGVPGNGLTPSAPNGVTPLTPVAPPVDSPSPAAPSEPLPPSPSAPTEALPPIDDNSFDDNSFDEGTPLGSTSDRLIGEGFTPFQLSYLAIGGGLKEAGIPGGNQLLSAYEAGDISAEDIVAAGAMTKRLGTAANDEADYAKGVDKFLKLLSRDGLNS